MQITNTFDPAIAERLQLELEEVIRAQPTLAQGEILTALVGAIGSTLISIRCRDCRKLTQKGIKKIVAKTLASAMAQAAKLPAGGDNHLH